MKKSINIIIAGAIILTVMRIAPAHASIYASQLSTSSNTGLFSSQQDFNLGSPNFSSATSTNNWLAFNLQSVNDACFASVSFREYADSAYAALISTTGFSQFLNSSTVQQMQPIPQFFSGIIAGNLANSSFVAGHYYKLRIPVTDCGDASRKISLFTNGTIPWFVMSDSLTDIFHGGSSGPIFVSLAFPTSATSTPDFSRWVLYVQNITSTARIGVQLSVIQNQAINYLSTDYAGLNQVFSSQSLVPFGVNVPPYPTILKSLLLSNGSYEAIPFLEIGTSTVTGAAVDFTINSSSSQPASSTVTFLAGPFQGSGFGRHDMVINPLCPAPNGILDVGGGLWWALCNLVYPHNYSQTFLADQFSQFQSVFPFNLFYGINSAIQSSTNVTADVSLIFPLPFEGHENDYITLMSSSSLMTVFGNASGTIFKSQMYKVEDAFMYGILGAAIYMITF